MSLKKTKSDSDPVETVTIGDRLTIFINDKNMLPSHLARETGAHPSTVSSYLNNETSPKKGFLRKLSEKFGLNPAWIEYGVGQMYLNQEAAAPAILAEQPAAYGDQVVELKHRLAEQILIGAELRDYHSQWLTKTIRAIAITASAYGLTVDQHRAVMDAVIDPEKAMAALENAMAHQPAAGNE